MAPRMLLIYVFNKVMFLPRFPFAGSMKNRCQEHSWIFKLAYAAPQWTGARHVALFTESEAFFSSINCSANSEGSSKTVQAHKFARCFSRLTYRCDTYYCHMTVVRATLGSHALTLTRACTNGSVLVAFKLNHINSNKASWKISFEYK